VFLFRSIAAVVDKETDRLYEIYEDCNLSEEDPVVTSNEAYDLQLTCKYLDQHCRSTLRRATLTYKEQLQQEKKFCKLALGVFFLRFPSADKAFFILFFSQQHCG
jgi:hypothetical protein